VYRAVSFFFTFGDFKSNSSSDSETITVLGFLGFVIVFELFETAFGAHLAKNAFASLASTRDVFLLSCCFGLDLSGGGSLGILLTIYISTMIMEYQVASRNRVMAIYETVKWRKGMNKVDLNNHKIRHVPSADPLMDMIEVDSYNVHILLQSTLSW
jgi:hypothetical protein